MTPRPRTAKKTAESTTPAKKTAAKRTTPAKPRTPRTRTRTQTAPALSLVKANTPPTATVVDLRKPLSVRRPHFVGPHTPAQLTEARATLASAAARLPVPHLLWLARIDGYAEAHLADGTRLVHVHERQPEFDAYIPCPTGALHQHRITTAAELEAARTATAACTRNHTDTGDGDGSGYDWHLAATRGVKRLVPARLSPLNAGLQTAKAAAADTQPMSLQEIGAHIAQQLAADTDTIKEHPES